MPVEIVEFTADEVKDIIARYCQNLYVENSHPNVKARHVELDVHIQHEDRSSYKYPVFRKAIVKLG